MFFLKGCILYKAEELRGRGEGFEHVLEEWVE